MGCMYVCVCIPGAAIQVVNAISVCLTKITKIKREDCLVSITTSVFELTESPISFKAHLLPFNGNNY